MSKKSILTAKQALKLQPDDYVFVNAGGGLRRMKVRGLEKLLRVPIPDVMYDFRGGDNSAADRETAKDLSGNGNDATIMNCAFNGTGSGYGGGGLQLDGVDDYVKMPETLKGLKTVFLEARTQELPATLYDQRSAWTDQSFAIYSPAGTTPALAYYSTNILGKTYINGELNQDGGNTGAGAEWKTTDLLGLRHLITVTNDKATGAPVIGTDLAASDFSPMTVYRFLGYKRLLTAEEIAEVIGAYGLLEDVDDPGAGDTDFDPSLADAWILSGRTNEEAPEAIAGEKGFSLSCQNFAWTAESGFDGQGFLVFDGVDDRLMSREDFGKALTVILSFRNLEKPNEWSMAMSLRSADGQKSISGSYYETGFGGNTSSGLSGCGLYRRPYSEEEETTDVWMNEEGFCGKGWTNQNSLSQKPDDLSTFAVGCAYNLAAHRKCAVRFFALYRESLSDEKCRSQLAYLTRLWESRKV